VEPARVAVNADRERITALERDVAALREEWIAFKKQFE
jgi:hypothetical protein